MSLFTFHYPYTQTISSDDMSEAIKKYLKIHRQASIDRLILSDANKAYKKAMMHYFMQDGRHKVNIKVSPYNAYYAPPGIIDNSQTGPLPQQMIPTLTPDGVVPSIKVNAHGIGPSSIIVPMLN